MNCWKCGKSVDVDKENSTECQNCKNPTLSDAKDAINKAKLHADNIDNGLEAFKEKIKVWRAEFPASPKRDMNRYIHHLCLMADELEDKVNQKAIVDPRDKDELLEKIRLVQELAEKLSLS